VLLLALNTENFGVPPYVRVSEVNIITSVGVFLFTWTSQNLQNDLFTVMAENQ
jgi:hypothetical protein